MSARSCKNWYLPFLLCLSVVFALMLVSPVSADDSLPADPPAVEEVTAPPQTDAPPTVEKPSPVEEAPASVDEPTVQEVTTAVADAGLVLADSSGTSTPMAARDTSLGVVEGDPSFKVGGVEYTFTHDDCDPGLE